MHELFEAHEPYLRRYLRGLTGSASDADDCAQEAFLRAARHYAEIRDLPAGMQRAWLIKTARNAWIDQKRKERREVYGEYFPEYADEMDGLSDWRAFELIDGLPDELGDIVRLRYISGFNSREIGRMLGLPEATVRTRLRRAVHLMRMEHGKIMEGY